MIVPPPPVAGSLQWGSETGSRRREAMAPEDVRRQVASMGLRDWVSEKGPTPRRGCAPQGASMGLRDWVSEKGGAGGPLGCRVGAGFNGAPRLGLGEG